MIWKIIFLILFVNKLVLSLRCKTAWPPNCIYNSTCLYNTTECILSSSSSNNRGGMYCSTLIKKSGKDDEILIGNMDCMYDQETSKPCKNQSQCQMKYTDKQNTFLHCCCDQHLCNLNFTLNNSFEIDPTKVINGGILSDPTYLILLSIVIGLILILILICFIYRNKLRKSLNKFLRVINKPSPTKANHFIEEENVPILIKEEPIDYNHLIIGNLLKRGRFSSIYEGKLNDSTIAIKMLNYQNENDESLILFEHEKQIYSLPFMTHPNILKYYGYSKSNESLCLITELSFYGSLRDVLRLRLLKDKTELILILKQISEGLKYLHNDYRNTTGLTRPPIAHRDLKTENILYLNSNQLVISDFAMSTKLDQNQNVPNQQQQIGTPRYMSPEVLAGAIGCEEDALLKCDVYALGIIFWEVLSRYPMEKDEDDKYSMPFEKQLMESKTILNINNPQVSDMSIIMNLPSPLNRPLFKQSWQSSDEQWLHDIIKTMEQSWYQTPQARITSALIAQRIEKLTI